MDKLKLMFSQVGVMNIKEVNVSLSQFISGKAGVQSQGGGELAQPQAFAELVAGVSLSPEAIIGSDAKSYDVRSSSAADASLKTIAKSKERSPVRDEKPVRNDGRKAGRNDKPVKESKRRDKAVPDAAAVETSQRDERPVARAAAENAVEAAPSAEVHPNADAAPVVRETVAEMPNSVQSSVAAIVDGVEVVLPTQEVDLSSLVSQAEVSVWDRSSGQVVTMSGAELAVKLQQASDAGQLFIAGAQVAEDKAELLPAEFSESAESRFGMSGAEIADMSAGKETASAVDDALVEQAQILDTKLDGRKTRVDVEVKEENFSRSDVDGLLEDTAAVDEAVKAVFKETNAESEGQKTTVDPLQNMQLRQNAAPVQSNMPNAAGAEMPTVADVSASVEATEAIRGGNEAPLNATHSALNGAAASQSLKAGPGVKAEETSFRDVYKGMSREAVEQVKVNIIKSAVKGVDKIDIQLKPEDLGHVQIKMQISKDGKLQAEIIASRQDTLEVLQKEAETLQKAFSDAGFDADGSSFSFSFRGEEEQNRNSELRNFIGNILEKEAGEELAGNDNQVWDPAQGLNIRV